MRLLFAPSGLNDHRPFSHLFDSVMSVNILKGLNFRRGQDVLVFEGGTDINSELYGEKPSAHNEYPNKARDDFESILFQIAKERSIPMIGICRGAQLITALHGGKLVQHMEGHHGNPFLTFPSLFKTKLIKGICAHHQACIPTEAARILALSVPDNVPEIFWYSDIKALCIQGHPAWGNGEFTEACVDLAKQLILGGKST